MINAKIVGMLLAAFVAGSFISSPELRAYAANTIRSGDIVDGEVKNADLGTNAVTTSKINDGAVKKADIATDAVDGEEIMGVTQLTFAECFVAGGISVNPGIILAPICTVDGADVGENVIATFNSHSALFNCFGISDARVSSLNTVRVGIANNCNVAAQFNDGTISIILFDVD